MQTGSWDIKDAPDGREILAWYPDTGEWDFAICTGIFGGKRHWSKGTDTESKAQPTRWAEPPSRPATPIEHRNVTAAQADSCVWWEHFLNSRMDAIQAMLILGKPDAEIMQQVGVDGVQGAGLICEARKRMVKTDG